MNNPAALTHEDLLEDVTSARYAQLATASAKGVTPLVTPHGNLCARRMRRARPKSRSLSGRGERCPLIIFRTNVKSSC